MDFRRPFGDIPAGMANRTQRDFQIFFDSLSPQERAEIRARCEVIGSDQRFIGWAREICKSVEQMQDSTEKGSSPNQKSGDQKGSQWSASHERSSALTGHSGWADRSNPARDYEVTTEEEQLGDLMFEAFRRISTKIYLPPSGGRIGIGDFVEIDPGQLEILMKPESGESARGLKGPEQC